MAMPSDPGCIFCRILAGQAEASFVLRGAQVSAFLAIPQAGPGHILIVPNEHAANAYDLPPALAGPVMGAALRLARVVKRVLATDGVTLIQNSEPGAGQTVMHFHLHVIGRQAGRRIDFRNPEGLLSRAALDALAARLAAGLEEEA